MSMIIKIINNFGTFMKFSWPFVILIILFIGRWRLKKYPIDAVIIEKRGDNLIKTNDRCGRFDDNFAGIVYYKLKKYKDTIPIYNYDWVLHNVSKPTNFLEKLVDMLQGNIGTIFLFKYGSKQYKPVDINVKEGIKTQFKEVKDDKGNPVWINVYQQFDPRDKLGALDFEVVDWDNINFMVQEQRASVERRKNKGDWIKQVVVPMGMIAGAVVISLVMMKFSMDYAQAIPAQGGTTAPREPATGANIPGIGDAFNPGA